MVRAAALEAFGLFREEGRPDPNYSSCRGFPRIFS